MASFCYYQSSYFKIKQLLFSGRLDFYNYLLFILLAENGAKVTYILTILMPDNWSDFDEKLYIYDSN
jgi:hypothetical protein